MTVVAATAIACPAMAQEQKAAPSEQTPAEMHRDQDKALKSSEPNEQMQRDADKGVKTRNSGQSGYVADQDKPGASASPPGRPETTTGMGNESSAPK
jgi:Ni/Co efflux regulator RcnB